MGIDMKSSFASFGLTFNGAALADHHMRVEDLAPSLLALSQAIDALNQTVNKNNAKVELSINAFRAGSFGIDLTLCQDFLAQVTGVLTGSNVTSICNAHTLVECVIEILMLKKWLQGRSDAHFEQVPETSTVKVTVDNRSININLYSYSGFLNQTCSEACSRIAAPLERSGVESMILSSKESSFELEASEYERFTASEPTTVLGENTATYMVVVESPSFKDGNKWKVSLGEKDSIFVQILDQDFLAKVNQGVERFRKGDLLKVDLQSLQTMTGGKMSIEYSIVKVHEHRQAIQQPNLF